MLFPDPDSPTNPSISPLFTSIFTLISFFLFLRDLGVGHALSKYIPEYIVREELSYIKSGIVFVFLFQIFSSLIFAIIFFTIAPYLAEYYFKNPAAKSILRLLLLYLFGSVIFRIFRRVSNGFQNMRLYSIFEPLKNIIILILLLLFLYLKKGVYAPVMAYVLVCYVVVIITFPFVWKIFPLTKYKIKDFKLVTKNLLLFGIPIFATNVAGKIITNIDTLILTNYRSLIEVGVYNVVLPSAMIFLFLGSSVSTVIFPIFSELWTKKDTKRMTEALRMIQKYSFVIIIPPALVIISFSRFWLRTSFKTFPFL